MIRQNATWILELNRQIKALEDDMARGAEKSTIAGQLESIPGYGSVRTAELAGDRNALVNPPLSKCLQYKGAVFSRISAYTKRDQTVVDVALESVRAVILLGIVFFLWRVGREKFDRTQNGWNLIVGGFGLLLFGSLLDISDNFEGLNYLVVVGDTEVEAILEKFVGFLGGFLVIAVGLMLWIPSVQRLNLEISQRNQAEDALRGARDELELRVEERTRDIEETNETLKREITERKRVEEALKDSENRFQSFAQIGSDWLWEMDANLRFSYFSEPIHRITRLPREHYLGKTRAEAGQGIADDEEWQQHLADLEAHRPFRDFCYKIDHADGTTHHWSISGSPIFDASGKFEGYRGVGSDITERKQAEAAMFAAMKEAEIANRTKSEFLANMSHELRTPLNAIIGFSEIIKDETFGPVGSTKYRDYAGDIHGAGQHLLDLINDILDVSKIESGADGLHEENIDVPKTVGSIIRLLTELAHTGNIQLEADVPEDLPLLHADERKLKQILVNLLSNAIKFTPNGGKVTIGIWSRSRSGYVFQVIDTGIGIAIEDIPKALAPFQQIDSGLNRKHEGSGLGLPLTKSLVEMHGGYLDLQSEVGVGTTVTVRFPAERIIPSLRDTKAVGAADTKAG